MGRHKKQKEVSTSVLKHLETGRFYIDLSGDESLIPYLRELPSDDRRCGFELTVEGSSKRREWTVTETHAYFDNPYALAIYYLRVAEKIEEMADELGEEEC